MARSPRHGLTLSAAGLGETQAFVLALRARGLPDPVRELTFLDARKWRFDYAWPSRRVALEVEGGVWAEGRHTRGQGFLDDMEKYNIATLLGWHVYRTTPDRLAQPWTLDLLRRALAPAFHHAPDARDPR